jgi:hypothetical protein
MKDLRKMLLRKSEKPEELPMSIILTIVILIVGTVSIVFDMLVGLVKLPWYLWQDFKWRRELKKKSGGG